ncbi:unnamed protein product [Lactuca saligna]|uniref:DUF8039 domain-containing protein n=1 Tax=Lactuca saligna TaxID=75948 RepID=A0AA35YLR8_LACSI|nr:unnamed protein product [Lactuca saligna]
MHNQPAISLATTKSREHHCAAIPPPGPYLFLDFPCPLPHISKSPSLQKRWNIHDENRKSYVLMTCNHKWRSYKKRLKKNFLVNENERNPLETYSYLEKTALQKFKERISSKEFQDISEKARITSMCNTNPARVGPHGYRGNKPKWEQEKESGQLPSQLYEIKSERSLDYVLGRRSKNESGSKIIPPNMEPIVKKLIDVQKEISNGDLLPGPGEDLLTMAIGPEHPGRTRAVGHDIGLRKGMQGLDKKKRKVVDKELVSKMQVQLDETVTQLAELRTLFAMQGSRNQVPNNVCFDVQNNRSSSTSTLDGLDTIKAITHCDLMLPYGDMNQKCARGMVFPYNDGLIHSVPLRENHLKVMIDNIDERYKGIPIPVMTNEVDILEDAVGTVIQWPRIAIVLSKEQQSKVPSQQQIHTTSARPSTAKAVIEKNMPNQKINKPRPIESLRDLLKTNLVVHVVADAGHLEAGAFDFSVTYEDYYRLLKKQTTNLSIITTWQILLHLMLQKRIGKCAFLNPYKILGKACQETPIDVVNYLVDVMQLHHGKEFLIAPYLQNTHWVLLVICPSNHIVYILDSLMKPMKNPVDNYYLLQLLKKASEMYEKNTSIPIVWKLTECNQAGVLERELSGHYVMNWIFDFVLNRQHGFPSRFGTLWNDKTAFEEKLLATTVATWAREFLKNFMNDVVV